MKRKRGSVNAAQHRKRQRKEANSQISPNVQHSIIGSYYLNVNTLGDVLQKWLPSTSRVRQRRLARFDKDFPEHAGFLSSILVGFNARSSLNVERVRRKELLSFTQTQREARGESHDHRICNISEIVEFVIWTLFRREQVATRAPDHLLCHGYQNAGCLRKGDDVEYNVVLPGITQRCCNPSVEALKQSPWKEVANLLGEDSGVILSGLLLDCGIFQRLEHGRDNLYQFSGLPISGMPPFLHETTPQPPSVHPRSSGSKVGHIRSILVQRNRMLYAKHSLNRQCMVQLGLNHTHVLNRYRRLNDALEDVRIVQYIFPQQFGLHNVFTSKPRPNLTKEVIKDYTFREQEVESLKDKHVFKLPRRLRGVCFELVRKLRKNHHNCSYTQLLRHYCPITPGQIDNPNSASLDSDDMIQSTISAQYVTQINLSPHKSAVTHQSNPNTTTTSFMQYASSTIQVSAFVKAALLRTLPRDTLGEGLDGKHNWTLLLQKVDKFLQLRRFDTFDLGELFSTVRIRCIGWLCPPKVKSGYKISMSDREKRLEILKELLYYVFDSLIIPLIRSNFYVTETGAYRNRLFYFRHDVWKTLADPSLSALKLSMFKPLSVHEFKQFSTENTMGYSQMRLLPKLQGIRPIMNLKSKATRIVGGKQVPERGVNKQLEPIFSVLKLERHRQPTMLASAIFSTSEIREKLVAFKARLSLPHKPFFFAKVDIQSCFDTIPQQDLLEYVKLFLLETEYRTNRHVEMKHISSTANGTSQRPISKWIQRAATTEQNTLLSSDAALQLSVKKNRHVFVRQDQEAAVKLTRIRKMLADHLQQNTVGIGRHHFRQVTGIPQGSILSSLLCNLFYGDFERRELSFLNPDESLLLRLTDDFLLITVDETQAERFVHCMSRGNLSHGIRINPDKSLVNFEVNFHGQKIPRIHGVASFPYCGLTIDPRNLQVCKDRHPKDVRVENGLTVAHTLRHRNGFQGKVVSSLRRQMHAVILDGTLNSRARVLGSIFECFVECGMKMHQQLRSSSRGQRPSQGQQIQLHSKLIGLGCRTMQNIATNNPVTVTRSQMSWLASVALGEVLGRKQSAYSEVLRWLHEVEVAGRQSMNMSDRELQALKERCMKLFVDYVY